MEPAFEKLLALLADECQVDVFTRISGRHFADFISEAGTFRIGTRSVRYISRPHLIDLKEHSVREKDRLDVLALRRLESGK